MVCAYHYTSYILWWRYRRIWFTVSGYILNIIVQHMYQSVLQPGWRVPRVGRVHCWGDIGKWNVYHFMFYIFVFYTIMQGKNETNDRLSLSRVPVSMKMPLNVQEYKSKKKVIARGWEIFENLQRARGTEEVGNRMWSIQIKL